MMLKTLVLASATYVSLSVSSALQAMPLHIPGSVSIVSSTTTDSMFGAFNVRYNSSAAANSYIATSISPGNVSFIGFDGTNNFSCMVPASSPLYQLAKEVHIGSSNGSFLSISKPLGSSTCTGISQNQASFFLD